MAEKVNVLQVEFQELRGRVPSAEEDLEKFKDWTRGSHFELDERVNHWTTRTMALEDNFNMMSVVQDTMVTEMRHNYDCLKLRMDEQHRDSSNSDGPEGAADDPVDYVDVAREEAQRRWRGSGPQGPPADGSQRQPHEHMTEHEWQHRRRQ